MDKVAVSVNSYVYEAIQRKYRNAVVKQIRTTLKARYGDDWEEQVKRPFNASRRYGIALPLLGSICNGKKMRLSVGFENITIQDVPFPPL